MKVSVIILNWNGRKLLERFLPSVLEYTPENLADIIVADNGSTDDSLYWLSNTYPEVKQIVLDQNYGFAGGYNRAIQEINTPYTVLLNSDVEVTPEWLSPLLDTLEKDPTIVAAQPKLLSKRNPNYFEYAGAAGGFLDSYGYPFCRGRLFDMIEEDLSQYDTTVTILWATGACLFIRTGAYKENGGLDEQFFAHQEEIDLCWRLRCRGHKIVCIPSSSVFHLGGATLEMKNPRKTYLNFRNNLLMLYKNLSEERLHRVMYIRTILDMAAGFSFLLKGEFRNVRALIAARRDFYRMRKQYKIIRKENLTHTTAHSITEIVSYSILVRFYLKGKKKFSQLYL